MKAIHGAVLALAALLCGCAPLHHKAMTAENKAKIQAVDIRIVVPQETFIFSANAPGISAAMGGGLIPALIDAGVQKSRQQGMRAEIQPLLDRLLDADFRAEARAAAESAMAGFPLKPGRVDVVARIPTKSEQDEAAAKTRNGTALLRLLVTYTIDPQSLMLTSRTQVALWQDGNSQLSYGVSAIAQVPPAPGAASGSVDTIRAQMRMAMAETLRIVAQDIRQPAGSAKDSQSAPFAIGGGNSFPIKGENMGEAGGRAMVRDGSGAVFSLQK